LTIRTQRNYLERCVLATNGSFKVNSGLINATIRLILWLSAARSRAIWIRANSSNTKDSDKEYCKKASNKLADRMRVSSLLRWN
jgi:hypothetical protein